MVIDDFDVCRADIRPDETDAPLVVDAGAVLPMPVASQCFQAIAGWRLQEIQGLRCIQLRQLAFCDGGEGPKLPRCSAFVQSQCVLALEGLNHGSVYNAARYIATGMRPSAPAWVAAEVADQVVFMHADHIHEMGPPNALFADPQTAEMKQFLSALPRPEGWRHPQPAARSIDGSLAPT